MTLWILHQSMTREQEERLPEQTYMALPFDGLPDPTTLHNVGEARKMIAALYPDDPPESITTRLEHFWPVYEGLHFEDIIVIPLPLTERVALAEVTGGYQYSVGEHGDDVHRVPVRFYPKPVPMSIFKKHKTLLVEGRQKMVEVTSPEARTLIREQLPHSYNRFAKFKWLMAVFFLLSLIRLFERITTH